MLFADLGLSLLRKTVSEVFRTATRPRGRWWPAVLWEFSEQPFDKLYSIPLHAFAHPFMLCGGIYGASCPDLLTGLINQQAYGVIFVKRFVRFSMCIERFCYVIG